MITRYCRILLLCTVTLALSACGQEERPDPAESAKQPALLANQSWPNVLLITIDSLRPDHLHCYGYPKQTSPRIDELAAGGAIFETAISNSSWSLPSHASILTSLTASIHGCLDSRSQLPGRQNTLAEELKSAGYTTAAFVSNPFLHPIFGLAQGFDRYAGSRSLQAGDGSYDPSVPTSPIIVAACKDWLTNAAKRPFVMFVNFNDANFDYTPPPPFDTRFDSDYTGTLTGKGFLTNPKITPDMPPRDLEHLKALYDGEIAWVDQHVGMLLDAFREAKLLDSTIVILTSSHGTAFFEHGLKGHRNALFDEVVRVPLIIRYPAQVPVGQRYPQQARGIDLFPTITALLGMPDPGLMGRSLTPVFVGQPLELPTRGKETAISDVRVYGHDLQMYRQPERKTIHDLTVKNDMVFDLIADPGELRLITDRESPTVRGASYDKKWSQEIYLPAFEAFKIPAVKLDQLPPPVIRRLLALGYLDGELPPPTPREP